MSCLEDECCTPSQPRLRQRFGFRQRQEISLFPPPPFQRAYDNKCYFVESSTAKQDDGDVSGAVEIHEKAKPALEPSFKWLLTSPLHTENYARSPGENFFDGCNRFRCSSPYLACCFEHPCCEIPRICQRRIGSPYDREGVYVQHFKALNSILMPNLTRMAHERKQWYVESATKEYDEAFGAGEGRRLLFRGKPSKDRETRRADAKTDVDSLRFKESTCYGRPQSKQHSNMEAINITQGLSERKRNNMDTFSETDYRQDTPAKRFKRESSSNEKTENWHHFKPVHPREQISSQSPEIDPTCMRNGYSIVVSKEIEMSMLQSRNRISSKELSRETKTGFPTDTTGCLKLKRFDVQVVEHKERRQNKVPEASCSSEILRDGLHKFTKTTCGNELKSTNDTNKFISLDSTKSSFLTLIKKMRNQTEDVVISCPYCPQTFVKYPDLKTHVQTHKSEVTEAQRKGGDPLLSEETKSMYLLPGITASRDEAPGNRARGNKVVGDNSPRGTFPGYRPSRKGLPGDRSLDDGAREDKALENGAPRDIPQSRATSVIMFAGQQQ